MKKIFIVFWITLAVTGFMNVGCVTTNEATPSDPLQFEGSWMIISEKFNDVYTFNGNKFIRTFNNMGVDFIGDSGVFTFTDKNITFYSARNNAKWSDTYTLNEGVLKIGRYKSQKLSEPLVLSTSIRIEGINGMKQGSIWIFKNLPFNDTNTALCSSYVQDNSLTVNLTLHETDNPSWEGMESSILWQGEGDYYIMIIPIEKSGYSDPLWIYSGDDGEPLQYSFTKHQSVVLPFSQFKIY